MDIKEGIIICSNDEKIRILKNESSVKHYKFLNVSSLISSFYGTLSLEGYLYLINEYNLDYDFITEIKSYLPYLDLTTYNNTKLDYLVKIKEDLLAKGFIKKDPLFIYSLKNTNITFINTLETKENIRLINDLKQITNVDIINSKTEEVTNVVYEYNDIYEECINLCNKIKKLNKQGISYSNIKIFNVSDDYLYYLKRMAVTYNIPFNFKGNKNILGYESVKSFLTYLNTLPTLNDCLEQVTNIELKNMLIDIINQYNLDGLSPKDTYKLFVSVLKNKKSEVNRYTDGVEFINDVKTNQDDYIFFLSFNLETTPKIYKDDTYLSDKELDILGLSTSVDKNIYENNKIVNIIKYTKNLYISYKKIMGKTSCLISNLAKTLNLEIKTEELAFGYSKVEDDIRLALNLDNYFKYNIIDSSIKKYDTAHLSFNKYDNKFKYLSASNLAQLQNSKLKLSYSTIKKYFACPFSYYLDNILKLNDFKDTINTRIGNFSHKVLERSYDKYFTEDEISKTLEEYQTSNKDIFYMNKMKDLLIKLITFNKSMEEESKLDKHSLETKIKIEEEDFIFEGIIDKLLYTIIDNEAYVLIIDYKTGLDILDLKNISDGANLQLPTYIHLLKNYDLFKGLKINVLGIYLQKVSLFTLKGDKDLEKQINDSFKLQGFTNQNREYINIISSNIEDYVKGLRFTKEGNFYKSSKVISDEDINTLDELVDKLIIDATKSIKEGVFDIAPKYIGKSNPCSYCKYKDICYKTYSDIINIEEKPFKEVGDDNAMD